MRTIISLLINALAVVLGAYLIPRITSYNVCYTKLLRQVKSGVVDLDELDDIHVTVHQLPCSTAFLHAFQFRHHVSGKA